jgi:hypothetical protein
MMRGKIQPKRNEEGVEHQNRHGAPMAKINDGDNQAGHLSLLIFMRAACFFRLPHYRRETAKTIEG